MRWRTSGLREENGIVVGSDDRQEWLLPWWWENYRKHNSFPVAFVDFGLSEKMKEWCRERGEWIRLRIADIFVKDKEEIESSRAEEWERTYGEGFWYSRKTWFKKPLACLQSPFKKSIWIDTDCEVLGKIEGMFEQEGFAIAKDQTCKGYNSGVMVFQRNDPIVQEWADLSFEKNGEFRGDQDLLSEILAGKMIAELPPIYNWNVGYGENRKALIYHWLGDRGKLALRHLIIGREE